MCPELSATELAADPDTEPSHGTAAPASFTEVTSKANQLASHLQDAIELERSHLTRQLHDDLGGLLVGALMDVAWVEARLREPDLQAKLGRARDSLRAAVDLKRNLIEAMRPTLLENVGVFAAMRWHFAKHCEAAGLENCLAELSVTEPVVMPGAAIGIYRIVEEALRLISGPLQARSIALHADFKSSALTVDFTHDGAAIAHEQLSELQEFKSMAQRVSTLHGSMSINRQGDGSIMWQFAVPIDSQPVDPSVTAR